MTRLAIHHLPKLFTCHLDAVLLTLLIAAACLLLHDRLYPSQLGLLGLLATTCWAAFAFNDYCDAPFDAQAEGKGARNFFAVTTISPRLFWGSAAVIAAMLAVSYAQFGTTGWLVWGVSLVAIWAYSAPPLRLKSRPVFDLLMHGTFVQTFPYLTCLLLIGVRWTALDQVLLAAFFLSSLAAQLEQQGRDFDLDSRTDANFTTVVGRRPATLLMRAFSAVCVLLLLTLPLSEPNALVLLPFGVIALPVVLHRFIRRADQPRSQRLMLLGLVMALLYMGGLWGAEWLRGR
jgi:4-hydroxybenzoate polyprenyltransferase